MRGAGILPRQYSWGQFLQGFGVQDASAIPTERLALFAKVFERHLESSNRLAPHNQATVVWLRPEHMRKLHALSHDPLRPQWPRVAEISQELLHREQWRPSRRLVRLARQWNIRPFEIPDYGMTKTWTSRTENGEVQEYMEWVRFEDTLGDVVNLDSQEGDDEPIPEADIVEELEKLESSDSETKSDSTLLEKAKKKDEHGSGQPVNGFLDKSPAPWQAQPGAFDSADKRVRRMAEKQQHKAKQIQAGKEHHMKNSANCLTRARASETDNHPLALSNAFEVLSSIKEESNQEIATLEDDSLQQTAEASLERASSSIQCMTSALGNNAESTSGGAFSSLARKRSRIAERSSAQNRDAVSGRSSSWRRPSLEEGRDREGVRGQTQYHDARKSSSWMNRKETDGRDLDWGKRND